MIEEDDNCPIEGCTGIMVIQVEGCSCHIAPPCNQCMEAKPFCSVCCYEEGA